MPHIEAKVAPTAPRRGLPLWCCGLIYHLLQFLCCQALWDGDHD